MRSEPVTNVDDEGYYVVKAEPKPDDFVWRVPSFWYPKSKERGGAVMVDQQEFDALKQKVDWLEETVNQKIPEFQKIVGDLLCRIDALESEVGSFPYSRATDNFRDAVR